MSDASVKVKPVDVLGSWVTVTCLVMALGFAAVMRSWSPLVFFAGFLLVVNIVQASASTLLAVRAGRQSWDAFTSVHVVVAASAVAFCAGKSVSRRCWAASRAACAAARAPWAAVSLT